MMPSEEVFAVAAAAEACLTEIQTRSPEVASEALSRLIGRPPGSILVVGPRSDRAVLVATQGSASRAILVRADGGPTGEHPIASWKGVSLWSPERAATRATIDHTAWHRLTRPRVGLLALCHPENFPLPRFALGISDMAASLRNRHLSQVFLMDMQVGATIDEMARACRDARTDIVGVSVTFGQHDLLEQLAARLADEVPGALLVVGGSLATLNSREILRAMPAALVAKGAGETTIGDVVDYWRGERSIGEINNIEYRADRPGSGKPPAARVSLPVMNGTPEPSSGACASRTPVEPAERGVPILRTDKHADDRSRVPMPELDLLEPTLSMRGVMQLESSRGCTFACSFCPRDHKGMWFGHVGSDYRTLLDDVGQLYDAHPEITRKIFLVDEEFFGYKEGADTRVLGIADAMRDAGFKFETSARMGQVYRPRKDRDWHRERARLWRQLVVLGLSRCLFGVESGVDSILLRFRKKTTSRQNTVGGRLLSLLGVPVRFTYITFDPLMSMAELIETYRFQGRTDIWLRRAPTLDEGRLLDIAEDDALAREWSSGKPLYSQIPYMLVSMECLIGSEYLNKVREAGLARDVNVLMGRQDAEFADPLIGSMSRHAQMWVDRNFALDYTLKSIIKIGSPEVQRLVRELREVIKRYAYRVLGAFLAAANNDASLAVCPEDGERALTLAGPLEATPTLPSDDPAPWATDVMAYLLEGLRRELGGAAERALSTELCDERIAGIIETALERWLETREWSLING